MKIGLIGLPQTGKITLFQILTGNKRPEQGAPGKTLMGTADIADSRFDRLLSMYSPQKESRAKIDLALLPRMEKETIAKGDIFKDIAEVDAICHVVRAFEDDAVYHPEGSVDPYRDIDGVGSELLLHDLVFVEKRIERIEAALKKLKDEKQQKELLLLRKMRTHLEQEKPLRMMEITEKESALIRSYPFITLKKMVLALNVGEDDIASTHLLGQLKERCEAFDMEAMQVSAQVESEIAQFDTEEEKREFMEELGIGEAALETLTRHCLKALGLISFFTVGPEEVHQWLIRKGATAPVAAGTIHSDLQRGFIRAEVMKYEELMEYKEETLLKKAGKIYLYGKDYVVEDGDIMNIRFKV